MKVLVVKSSYRQNSNSGILADRTVEAMPSECVVETINIGRDTISNCRGCYACLLPENKDYCIIKDDMHKYYEIVRNADAILFVTPVYWFDMCGQIKQFIDRCFAVAALIVDNKSLFAGKKIGAVFAYEGMDPLDSGCVNAVRVFENICQYTGAHWMGALYGTADKAGEMESNGDALKRAVEYGVSIIH